MILRHVNVRGFGGGFVGVDVFFVISGYLITAVLQGLPAMPMRRQIGQFYLRRARRILPALFGCLLVSTAIALCLEFPDQLTAFGRMLAFASVSLANVGVHLNGGYFTAAANFSPLTPLWSIAVEEQFYLLYPLAFLVCLRAAPRLLTPLLLTAAAASFALCVWSSYAYPMITYYLAPQRAWELLLGAVALLTQDALRFRRIVREVAAATAVLVILGSVALYNQNMRYPGTAALAPVLSAACLLIVNRGPELTLVARLLSLRPAVFTGLISYSLYLWHGPIFDFFRTYTVEPLGAGTIASLIVLLYAVATVSWRSIELPFRSRRALRNDGAFGLTAAAISVAFLLGGTALWLSHGLPARFDNYVQAIFREEPFAARLAHCPRVSPEEIAAGHLCHFGTRDVAARKVLVWGDSHALALVSAYRSLAEREHLNLYMETEPACRPLLGVLGDSMSDESAEVCRRANRAMLRAIDVLRPDVIVLNAYWLKPTLELRSDDRRPISFEDALLATLRSVRRPGVELCAVLDVPSYSYQVPLALATYHRRGQDPAALAMTRAQSDLQQSAVESAFMKIAATGNLRLVNPRDVLCAGSVCRLTTADGMPLYVDGHHLSVAGAEAVEETLRKCFAADAGMEGVGGRYRD